MSTEALYEVTRGSWVIGKRREKARYAFALFRGIVRAVYRIDRWYPATEKREGYNASNRWYFDGEVASDLLHYIGGSVIAHHGIANAQNPIRYVN
jgi:hypothetical protein